MKRVNISNRKGFTLVELIVVMAIIAILAAVVVPTTIHFVNDSNVSAELQEVRATRDNAVSFITNKTARGFDITNIKENHIEDFKSAIPVTKSLEYIEYKIVYDNNSYKITVSAKGINFDIDKSGYKDVFVGKYNDSQIYKKEGATEVGTKVSSSATTTTVKATYENGVLSDIVYGTPATPA